MAFRILHTSDWHLGHTFHGYERAYEHVRFLRWLLDCLVEEQPNALLLAGDVFDATNPPASAQRRLYDFLAEARCRLPELSTVLIAGNHDSAGRVEAPALVLQAVGARAIGVPRRGPGGAPDPSSLVCSLPSRPGGVGAWCVAVPFLRPSDMLSAPGDAGEAYAASVAALWGRAVNLAAERCRPDQPLIAVGHCHLNGGQISADSERPIVMGAAEALPSEMFDERLTYVALGHLHRAQQIGKDGRIRYSGSPLPMSFTERDYEHCVLVVDFDGPELMEVRPRRVPRFVGVKRIPEQPLPLDRVVQELEALPKADGLPEERPYLEVRVLLNRPEPGLRARIEAALAGRSARLARIETVYAVERGATRSALANSPELARLDPASVFERRYLDDYPAPVPADLRRAFDELLAGLGLDAS